MRIVSIPAIHLRVYALVHSVIFIELLSGTLRDTRVLAERKRNWVSVVLEFGKR